MLDEIAAAGVVRRADYLLTLRPPYAALSRADQSDRDRAARDEAGIRSGRSSVCSTAAEPGNPILGATGSIVRRAP